MYPVLRMILLAIVISTPALAAEQTVFGNLKQLKIEEEVSWIEETPARPESYIGQLFMLDKAYVSTAYFAQVPLNVAVEEEASIKKSILLKSSSDGSVSFLGIFKLSGQKESVYQFQIVQGKKW